MLSRSADEAGPWSWDNRPAGQVIAVTMTDKYDLPVFSRLLASPRVRVGLLLLVLACCGYGIHAEWPQMRAALGQLHWYSVLASIAAAMAGGACMMLAWRAVLADLGSRLPVPAAVRVNFLAQLAKYVPGAVWSVAAMVELGHDKAVPRRRGGASIAIGLAISVAVGLAVAAVTLPLASSAAARHYRWTAVVIPVIAVFLYPPILGRLVDLALTLVRMQPLERRPTLRGLVSAVGWTALGWLFLGLQVWVVLTDVASRVPHSFLLALGAYALACSAGLLLVIFPSGIGPRDLILVAVLGTVLPHGTGVAIALVARASTTASDLAWGAIALAVGRSRVALGRRAPGRHRRPADERLAARAEPAATTGPVTVTPS
jgi:glycosyltransferase 2 family protein